MRKRSLAGNEILAEKGQLIIVDIEKQRERVKQIISILEVEYPDARCLLNFTNPLELLVATILAAQSTDERVNMITKDLFKKYQTAQDYANADLEGLMAEIHTIGLYRNKAKSIKACCARLVSKYDGAVPAKLGDLAACPGVGRKTANVVLGNAFGIPSIIVDTHVRRVVARIGLSKETNPDKIEFDLMKIVPHSQWTWFSHLIGFSGRRVCVARKPRCTICKILLLCDYGVKVSDLRR